MRNVDLQTLHPGSADFCVRRPRRVLPPLFFLAKLCTVLVFARNPLISMWYHRVGGYASGSYQDFTVFEFVVGIPIGNAITISIIVGSSVLGRNSYARPSLGIPMGLAV